MGFIAIVGAGITGLAAAWELQQQGIGYTLLEASDRFGGKLITERTDGFIIEAGADSLLTSKPWAWHLCREIGLADRLIPTNTERRTVYVFRHGKLQPFPRGMRLIVPVDPDGLRDTELLSEAGKRRMLAEVDIPPRTDATDESLAAFVRRRFGDEALDVFGESLLSGIHAGDPEQLSIRATFPDYPRLERAFGSVIRGMRTAPPAPRDPDLPGSMFVSPRGGMIELTETLRGQLTGDLRLNTPVRRIAPDRTIQLANGDSLRPEGILLSTPVRAAGKLVEAIAPEASQALAAFKTVSSGTISLGFRRDDLPPLDGYGFVIPRTEPTRITACTWSSTKLAGRAPEGYVLLRVFVGGHGREEDVERSDAELVALARTDLAAIMGIHAHPVLTRVFRWRGSSPQYEVGHLDRVARLRALCPAWVQLAGCAYEGVGVPDCVRQGRQAAQSLLEKV